MDQKILSVIAPVMHLVFPEGHVPHRKIEEVVRVAAVLKPADRNVGFLVKLSGNASGQVVKLHTVQICLSVSFRHQPEKVPDAAGRFQDIPWHKIHAADCFIHRLDDSGAGIVGVQHRALCGSVFFRQ